MIIGIDIGTNTGWAVLQHDGTRRDSGTLRLGLRPATKTREADHRAVRWLEMLAGMRALLSTWRPAAVAFERVIAMAQSAGAANLLVHGGLRAQLEIAAHETGTPLVELSPGEWKRCACGRGNATKPDYIASANERHGLHLGPKCEDEAAALGIGYAAIKLGKVGAA